MAADQDTKSMQSEIEKTKMRTLKNPIDGFP